MREEISSKQGLLLIIIFILNGSLMLPIALYAKKDLWIAILISLLIASIFIYIYSKILSFYPGKDLFDILNIALGKFLGKFFSILYIWYAFHLASIILRDFGEYFISIALQETPLYAVLFPPILLSIFLLKKGIEVIGRTNYILGIMIFIMMVFWISLLIVEIDINNIKPMLQEGVTPVLKGAYSTLTFPFAETILFTAILSSLSNKKKITSVYLKGLLIGGLILFIISFVEITVLGYNLYSRLYFPGYETLTRVTVGEIFKRIEIVGGIIFTIATFIKMSICIYFVNKGFQKVFNIKDYKIIVIPISLLVLNLSLFLYDSIMELVEWSTNVWPLYSMPFQIIIPLLIYILLIIKKRKNKLLIVE